MRKPQIFRKLRIIQDRTYQKDCRSTQQLCLIDHVGIHGKILAQTWNTDSRRDFLQKAVLPTKPFWLSENGNGRSARRLIGTCYVQIREIRSDYSLGGRSLLTFTDKMDSLSGQRLFKWEFLRAGCSPTCGKCLFPYFFERVFFLFFRHSFHGMLCQAVQNRPHVFYLSLWCHCLFFSSSHAGAP